MTPVLIAVYLTAIAAANLAAATWGPSVTPFTAFLLIGLDLSTRDALHEAWEHKHLWLKMAALVAAGSLLSYVVSLTFGSGPIVGKIAVASCVAFALAGLVDTVAYRLLRKHPRLVRMNGSNAPAALVDSIVFPTLAFGVFLPAIVLGQFLAKVAGGFVWSLVLTRRRVAVA